MVADLSKLCSRITVAGLAALLIAGGHRAAAEQAAVDGERMRHADTGTNVGSWMSYGRSWDEQRYSPLRQINDGNVSELGLVWYADLGTSRGVQATPLVIDGVLYNTSVFNIITAYDAATGEQLWTYDPEIDRDWVRVTCCGPNSRGIAAWDGKLFIATLDGRLIALDAASGDEIWSRQTFTRDRPYSITGAPRVFDGKVVIGNGGAEFGVRGFVSAYDANSGERLWKFYTVPGNPADGPDGEASDSAMEMALPTWNGEWWRVGGGGTAWDSIIYDPDLNLVYIGTGNGSPHVAEIRSPGGGDNLFLCSIVAVDADSGEYRWHYQMVPGESWDFTCTQSLVLADLEIEGRQRHVLMQAPKNGFFYVLDRATGELISAETYVGNTWATHIDPASGRPVETAVARLTLEPQLLMPGPGGTHNWHPMAFSPDTGLAYIPAYEMWAVMARIPTEEFEYVPMSRNSGLDRESRPELRRQLQHLADDRERGFTLAWDPVNQREAFRIEHPFPGSGGTLATGGNLLFHGTPGKVFAAYRADNGELLWQFPTQNVPIAGPVTYMVAGEQYVAVNVGWSGMPVAAIADDPDWLNMPGARLMVFKLGGETQLPPFLRALEIAEPPAVSATDGVIREGERLYNANCFSCHGAEARGGVKDLRWMSADTHASFIDIVLGGSRSQLGMASFANVLEPDQAAAIHQYIISRAREDWRAVNSAPDD